MQLVAVYLAVVLIWSTTPLGIVWSSETVSPSLAVLLRMVIALVIGALVIKLSRIKLPWCALSLRFYSYSAIGVTGGMLLSYMAARTIPSGMLSLIFGFSPILSGLFGQRILGERAFSSVKKCALIFAFLGLAVVCYDKILLSPQIVPINLVDLLFMFLAVILFSLSGVLVKSVNISMHPLASTVGTLTVSVPVFLLCWGIIDGNLSTSRFEAKSVWSIVYLGIFGSLFGFIGYFYILKRLAASTVSLVTLITPVIAIFLGQQLNNEVITYNLLVGTALILIGLCLYFFGNKALASLASRRVAKKRCE